MSRGPKGAKRPRDPAQLAKFIVDVATGEVEDRELTSEEQGKNPAAVALGRLGGKRGGMSRAKSVVLTKGPMQKFQTDPLPSARECCTLQCQMLTARRGELAPHQSKEVAMRKHRDFNDLPCFRDHA